MSRGLEKFNAERPPISTPANERGVGGCGHRPRTGREEQLSGLAWPLQAAVASQPPWRSAQTHPARVQMEVVRRVRRLVAPDRATADST